MSPTATEKAGKLSWAFEDILGDLIADGQINTKKGDEALLKKIPLTFAGHPIPVSFQEGS